MSTTEQTNEVETLVRSTLASHLSLFLATAGRDGPWINGVYFAETDPFTISLVLEQRGRTLAAIRQCSTVALIVSTGTPADPFLQGRATAEVLEGAAADEVRRLLVAKVPAAAAFMAAPIESLRLVVDSWRVTDVPNGWLPGRELANLTKGG